MSRSSEGLPDFIAGEIKLAFKECRRAPLQTPDALRRLAFHLGGRSARRDHQAWPARWIRERYLFSQPEELARTSEQIRRATQSAYDASTPASPTGDGGVALVLMLRSYGAFRLHAYHHYLIACTLRKQGYDVVLVRCRGEAEDCGSGRPGKLRKGPPFLCRECHDSALDFHTGEFEVAYLDDYADADEDGVVEAATADVSQPLDTLTLGPLPFGRLASPYLLRYFKGHRDRLDLAEPDAAHHVKGALRMALRYEKLVAERGPSWAVLFNGLWVPEHLLSDINGRNGVATLYTERGPLPDSLFISDEIAPHYRASKLWESEKKRIGVKEREIAEAYVQGRRQKNVGPSGQLRPIQVDDPDKYRKLCEVPYVVFFPPIFYDTVSMEKDSCFGNIFDAIEELCREAHRCKSRLVVRCHPDEGADGGKGGYNVGHFLREKGLIPSEHIVCLDGAEQWNAYLLAENAGAVVIYNGSLGMELPALGRKIYNLAASHYTGKGFTQEIHRPEDLEDIFLQEEADLPIDQREVALAYLWFYYFRASIDLGSLVDEYEPGRITFADGSRVPEAKRVFEEIDQRVTFLLQGRRP